MIRLPKEFQYAYHRTQLSNVSSIAKSGFTPGWGDMYGRGWYMCYDLESQLKPGMTHYGDAVIKSEIFPRGLLIFDYNIAKRVFGSDYSLVDQALAQNIYRSEEEVPYMFSMMSQALSESLHNPKYSAVVASHIWVGGKGSKKIDPMDMGKSWRDNANSFLDPSKGTPKNKKITAIMFSGNHDGNVIVVYNPNTAIPKEYALLSRDELMNIDSVDDIKWTPIEEVDIATKRADLTRQVFDLFNGRCLKIEISPKSKIRNLSMFKTAFPWLLKGDFSDAEFIINEDDQIIMTEGIWKGGIFGYGAMGRNATFKSGIWKGFAFTGNWIAGRWGQPDATSWAGNVSSKSKFTYETEDEDYITTKESPDEYFN